MIAASCRKAYLRKVYKQLRYFREHRSCKHIKFHKRHKIKMSFIFSNVLVIFLLFIVDVTKNKFLLVQTINEETDNKDFKKLAEKGQDYSDDDDFKTDTASRFDPVFHMRKFHSKGDNQGSDVVEEDSFWNKEGHGFEPEVVTEVVEDENSFWNREGQGFEPEVVTEILSTNTTEKKADYDIPVDFLKMLTKPAE